MANVMYVNVEVWVNNIKGAFGNGTVYMVVMRCFIGNCDYST